MKITSRNDMAVSFFNQELVLRMYEKKPASRYGRFFWGFRTFFRVRFKNGLVYGYWNFKMQLELIDKPIQQNIILLVDHAQYIIT